MGRGGLGIKSFLHLSLTMLYTKHCFSEGPVYLVSQNLTSPSHFSVSCCQQLIPESQLDLARLLCLKLKSMLACFHGNGREQMPVTRFPFSDVDLDHF